MIPVSSDEHLSSLLVTYQFAEKLYGQMVIIADEAAFRRDEAEKFKIEAFERYRKARDKFSRAGELKAIIPQVPQESLLEAKRETTENAILEHEKRMVPGPSDTKLVTTAAPSERGLITPPPNSIRLATAGERSLGKASFSTPPSSPLRTHKSLVERPLTTKSSLSEADQILLSPRRPIRAMIAESNSKASKGSPVRGLPDATESPKVIHATNNAANCSLSNQGDADHGESGTRKKTVVALRGFNQPKPTLQITIGRSREWLQKNFDNYDSFGLVKKFYQASFGTKTNEKTQKVSVRTILLTDEWNDLAADTSMVQEMYVIKSTGENTNISNVSPLQRDRAAHALVDPPQSLPIALFFAPKKTMKTNDVYYVGHWRVVDGKILDPPEMVNGQLRQTMAKLAFAGVDRNIVEAFNKED